MTDILRNYSPQDRDAVFDIMQSNLQKELPMQHKNYLEWLEKRAGFGKNKENASLVFESEGKPIGYLGVIPCEFKIGAQRIDTGFVFDVFSDPDKRGVGIKLLKKIVYSDYLHFGAPGERVETLWSKLARKESDNIVVAQLIKAVGIVDPHVLLVKKGLPGPIANPLAKLWKSVLGINIQIRNIGSSHTLRLTKEGHFPDDAEALFHEFADGFYAIALKTTDYFAWRFCDPLFRYEKVFVRDDAGKLIGYLVYRCGTMNGRQVMLIIEAIAVGRQAAECYNLMLDSVYKEALRSGVSDIQTNISGCPLFYKALKNKIIFKKNESCSIISNFSYFKAIERVNNGGNWFFSLADSDFEFASFKFDTD